MINLRVKIRLNLMLVSILIILDDPPGQELVLIKTWALN